MHQPADRTRGGELVGPVHWRESVARAHPFVNRRPHHHRALLAFHQHQALFRHAAPCRVAGMQRKVWCGDMGHQMRHPPRAGHGVPLIADPSGVEREREIRPVFADRRSHRHHARTAVRRGKATPRE